MRTLNIRKLAQESHGIGEHVPMTISPDTDEQALALEELEIAVENISNGVNLNGSLESLLIKIGSERGISVEDYGDASKYGAIAAIIAVVLGMIAWAVSKLKGQDSSSTRSSISTVTDNAAAITKAPDVPESPEYKELKEKMWSAHVIGYTGLRVADLDFCSTFIKAYGTFVNEAVTDIKANDHKYMLAIRAAIDYGETMSTYLVPMAVVEKLHTVMRLCGRTVAGKEYEVKVDSSLDEQHRILDVYSQLLKHCDDATRDLSAYRPAYNDAAMEKTISKGFVEDLSVEAVEQNLKTNDAVMNELIKLQKALTKIQGSTKNKLHVNKSVRQSLASTLSLIKLLLAWHTWTLADLQHVKAMQSKYMAFQKKGDGPAKP